VLRARGRFRNLRGFRTRTGDYLSDAREEKLKEKNGMKSSGEVYVNIEDISGSDERIARIAGISYGRDYKTICIGDESGERMGVVSDGIDNVKLSSVAQRLIPHLIHRGHWTPFEFCYFTVKVRAPIFTSRQWMRHRSLSYLEESRRYTSGEVIVRRPEGLSRYLQNSIDEHLVENADLYRQLLESGVKKEDARTILPLGTYTTFYASGNLRNWCHFLRQRMHSSAQEDIREYANAIFHEVLEEEFPITASSFLLEFFPGGL